MHNELVSLHSLERLCIGCESRDFSRECPVPIRLRVLGPPSPQASTCAWRPSQFEYLRKYKNLQLNIYSRQLAVYPFEPAIVFGSRKRRHAPTLESLPTDVDRHPRKKPKHAPPSKPIASSVLLGSGTTSAIIPLVRGVLCELNQQDAVNPLEAPADES